VQRKELAQKTKDFRKLDDASKLSDIKGLLKGMLSWRTFAWRIAADQKQPTRPSSTY
jgi:hypothetical protein